MDKFRVRAQMSHDFTRTKQRITDLLNSFSTLSLDTYSPTSPTSNLTPIDSIFNLGFDDPNIYSDPDTNTNTRYSDGKLMACTLPKIIEKLTKDIDIDFIVDFLMTFRSYLEPLDFARLLIARFKFSALVQDEEHDVARLRLNFLTLDVLS